MTAIWQAKESWKALVLASAALGLTLYYLHAQQTPTSKSANTSRVHTEQCQDNEAIHVPDAMDPEERAYHEGFMREAIAMVNHALRFTTFYLYPKPPLPCLDPMLTHHRYRLNLH
jgi:tRNA-specific adenosine deaminase 2